VAVANNNTSGIAINSSYITLRNLLNLTSLATAFTGKITVDDPINLNDSNGSAPFPSNSLSFDWSGFINPYRAWGKNGSVFPSADNRGRWMSGTGRIWGLVDSFKGRADT
jgi:hypothetical protein